MAIQKICAQLNCVELEKSVRWFGKLFGHQPDARPMHGLAEWHDHQSGGFQLFQNEAAAGHGTMTLIVSGIRDEHARLEALGLEPPSIQPADTTSLILLRDPDNNLVVLAQPGRA